MTLESPTVSVLLGAGASADAGLPTTVDMTAQVLGRIEDPDRRRLLDFVRHMLEADAAMQNARMRNTPAHRRELVTVDIERLFAAVELLVDRSNQAWAPFVASWHAGLESFAPRSRVDPYRFDRLFDGLTSEISDLRRALDSSSRRGPSWGFRSSYFHGSGGREIGRAIATAINDAQESDVGPVLRAAADAMVRALRDVLAIGDSSVLAYLDPLLELAARQGWVDVATLNYDRSIEQLAELRDVEYESTFGWQVGGHSVVVEPVRLYKLHGSIDWVFVNEDTREELPFRSVRPLDPSSEQDLRLPPAIVFGEGGKLRAEGPFLSLLLAWESSLDDARSLLVAGYSFRDQHVNELIARWFFERRDRRIVFLNRSAPAAPFARRLRQMAASSAVGRVRFVEGRTKDHLADAIEAAASPIVSDDASV